MTEYVLEIIEEDINRGRVGEPTSCVVAIALQRQFKDPYAYSLASFGSARLTTKKWKIFPTKKLLRFKYSDRLKGVVISFDSYGSYGVKPGKYIMWSKD